MTRALYHDPGTEHGPLLVFQATVTAVQAGAGGNGGGLLALDQTAFYPEGGGQNADTGRLRWAAGEARVEDVRKDKASGVVWHRAVGVLPEVGTQVWAEVDEARRWRHSQRHSGEHLLAQAFLRISPAFTVAAVSMGSPECTLDLHGDPSEADVLAAEALLRETLGRQPLRLQTPVVPEADLHLYPLRRATGIRGEVRLVIFGDSGGTPFDVSACGGTHVPWASLAAPVVVLRTERIRAGLTRVVFMAGEEAGAYLAGVYREARTLAQGFSVSVDRLPERVAALLAEREELKTEAAALRDQLAAAWVASASAQTLTLPSGDEVTLRQLSVPEASLLLPALTATPPGEALLVLAPAGRCGLGSAHPAVHAGAVLGAILKTQGGKGGGQAAAAQGMSPQPEQLAGAVRAALAEIRLV